MIWILIPAFNEENSLPLLLPKISKTLEDKNFTYKIVVVNDGSKDKTAEILENYKKNLPLTVIEHHINRGLGETERDGFEYIARNCNREDYIVRVEGDDTHEPEYILKLIDKLKTGYDVVNTSRFQPGGKQIGVSPYRAFISKCANIFMHLVFQIKGVKDFSCGFRAYRASVIQDAVKIYENNFIQLRGMGFTSTLEIIVKLNLIGCRFAEIPFILRYDQKKSESKMIGSITTLGYLIMAILYYWPFGGWKAGYRGLKKLYPENPEAALKKYGRAGLKQKTVSNISF